jgi:Fe-S-cluster containining protein
METLPCSGCKGLCCGPVPVSAQELKVIKKKIKSMPHKNRVELEHQLRHYGTCIFYDLDNDKCGIHSARPAVCRAFGHYHNLICFRKPEAAAAANWKSKDKHVGILSQDFTWKDFK